ncbi:alpha/beta fold hydrolase [Rheinheimera pacifica]|uniref:alpha/beta hydrolase family protein n=1 Tax=Rheinheimera pacifica TaxID=173990 RepID=UPI00286BCDA1|nr:alpha/beta fold hydrolase [Rheinheimera pacifica]
MYCLPVSADSRIDMVDLLSQNPTYTNVQISPDGRFISAVVNIDNKTALGIIERKGFKMVNAIRFPGREEIGSYFWANNERLVIKMAETMPWKQEPLFYGELFAVNWDSSKGSLIYGYRAGEMQTGSNIKKKEATKGWADIVSVLPDNEKQILIASTPWSEGGDRLAELMLLDIYSGKMRKVGHSPIPYAYFIADQEGALKLAVGVDKNDNRQVYRYNSKGKDWSQVPLSSFGNRFSAIGLDETADAVYVLDDFRQDKTGLFKLNLADFSYQEIFTDKKVDIADFEHTKNDNRIFALKLDDGLPNYVLLSDKYAEAQIFKDLLTTFPGNAVTITSKTTNEQFWVVATYSDISAGSYFLFDKKNNSMTKLFDRMPALTKTELATTQAISFKSFDDTDIHGYFTAGKSDSVNKPLIVNVHGGPHNVRDSWGFDREVQLLATAGYSVLQLNYRGSGGYGLKHQMAGYLQWGDAIQQDIIAGTRWAIDSGKAKAGNICIVGTSFGGYSAVQSATLAPDLYSCVVAVAGVYDLTIMKGEGDIPKMAFGVSYLERVLGKDDAVLQHFSPVNHVGKLEAALFLAHGKRDKRAPLEHATRLKAALDKAGKKYQWLQFNDESHGFYSPENRSVYYQQLLDFVSRHLML